MKGRRKEEKGEKDARTPRFHCMDFAGGDTYQVCEIICCWNLLHALQFDTLKQFRIKLNENLEVLDEKL